MLANSVNHNQKIEPSGKTAISINTSSEATLQLWLRNVGNLHCLFSNSGHLECDQAVTLPVSICRLLHVLTSFAACLLYVQGFITPLSVSGSETGKKRSLEGVWFFIFYSTFIITCNNTYFLLEKLDSISVFLLRLYHVCSWHWSVHTHQIQFVSVAIVTKIQN